MTAGTVSFAKRSPPLVLALDVGSSAVRCTVFDSQIRAVSQMAARKPHRLACGRDGSSTADPDTLLGLLFGCVDVVLERLGSAAVEIAGVGSCTFVANVVGLDKAGHPITPLSTYADTTAWPQAQALANELDQERLRQRVGCYFHPSYLPARLRLWKESDAVFFHRVARWATLGEYLEQVLFSYGRGLEEGGVTHSVASWSGLLNRHRLMWDELLLDHLDVQLRTLPPLTDVSSFRVGLRPEFALRWPALREVPWFPAIGDGAAANLGSVMPGSRPAVVVTLGTSGAMRLISSGPVSFIPQGLWCYRVDQTRELPGGSLSEGGNVYAWLRRILRLNDPVGVEKAISGMQPDAHGLSFLPFLAGERSPGWWGNARASIHGITLATQPLEILRAGMEAVALRLGLIYERLLPLLAVTLGDETVETPVIAGGGAFAASVAWVQMLADVLGCQVARCELEEVSSRGVAVMVLSLLGTAPNPDDCAVPATIFYPDSDAYAAYRRAGERQVRLYDALRHHDSVQRAVDSGSY